MTYDSSKIDRRQVAIFKKMLLEMVQPFWNETIALSYAQALEESASEVRLIAVQGQINDAAKNEII